MSEAVLKVRLLCCTPQPETAAALGARLCYSDSGIDDLYERVAPEAETMVDKLMGLGHLSPIEHASFTFGVEGVSRSLLAQLTRHRIASFSVQSQRYVKKSGGADYIVPPGIRALGEDALAEYESQMAQINEYYKRWLDMGVPAEDARFVLPNAAETRLVMTMNARELLHFFSLRCCERAQWEIRRLAWTMLGIARREAPALFKNGGTSCCGGACSEGKMCCGRAARVKELSSELSALCASSPTDEEILNWVLEHIGGAETERK